MNLYPTHTPITLADANPYRDLISARHQHILRDGTPASFSERHLQCIWYDPKLRPAKLSTRTGERVTVLDPGRWNREAGPDFLDAVLLVEPELRRIHGDVEIHIHPTDWEHHGHTGDSRYDRVIAHVTYFPGLGTPAGLPPASLEIALEHPLEQNHAFRMEQIDIDAYPFAARLQECSCGMHLKQHPTLTPESLLHAAGIYRFEQKIQNMSVALHHGHINDVLYHKTMLALGYKQHTQAFGRLAERIPLRDIRQKAQLEAYTILLGSAGLLKDDLPTNTPVANKQFLRTVWDIWWQYRNATPQQDPLDWEGPPGRPTNQPVRRLAAAAALFSRQDPWEQITDALQHPKQYKRKLQALFAPTGPMTFWLHHINLTQPALKTPKALVGKDRLAAWLNNVILPLAAAQGTPTASLTTLFMPEQINAVVRHTAARLFGRDHNPSFYRKSGILQQGLLQIYQDHCRKGCHDCTLADALKQDQRICT